MPGAPRRPIPPRNIPARPAPVPAARPRPAAAQIAPPKMNAPRPAVRPLQAPQRIMPRQPAPVTRPAARPVQGMPRPVARPAAPAVRPRPVVPPRPGVPAAGTAAAVAAGAVAAGAIGQVVLNRGAAPAELSAEISSLDTALTDLNSKASLESTFSEMNQLATDLNDLVALVESARAEGYRYQGSLDNEIYSLKSQWDTLHPQLFDRAQMQTQTLQARLPGVYNQVNVVNNNLYHAAAARSAIQLAHTQINGVLQNADQVERNLEGQYQPLRDQAWKYKQRLTQIHWAMDQLAAAKFRLAEGELLVMAVAARWDQEGKDDPEGILYLSNRRLIFERKEKVAVKKILFITTASELVQEVLIDRPMDAIKAARPDNKGLFGNQDYLLVELAGTTGTVALHLQGQDAKEWSALVERVHTGQIETDRYSDVGVSVADLSRPLTQEDLLSVQAEANQLQDRMMLKACRADLAEVENDVSGMSRQLAELRAKGYAMEKDLEADVTILATQWERIKANADAVIDRQCGSLAEQNAQIQRMAMELLGMAANLAGARSKYVQVKSAMAAAGSQADAAMETVAVQYAQYAQEVESVSAHLDWVGWMLDALATASFRLLATEGGIAATEAMWGYEGSEPENGILYLTDQRLLWEDRVGAFELKVNVPLQYVQEVTKTSEEDVEYLYFTFASGAPFTSTRFRLGLPVADEWIKIVGRARTGEYTQGRAIDVDQKEVERIKNAPQQCEKCGSALTAPVLRGQTSIACEYCGTVMHF